MAGDSMHVRSRRVLATWSVCVSLATACSSQPDVTATDADAGGQVRVRQGQVLDIVLSDDYATSNAQWRDDDTHDDAVLHKLGSKYDPNQTVPGHTAFGTYTGRYQGAKAGTAHVTLVQEDDALPPHVVKRFVVDVTVN
jgi:predicted secreted protein